MDLAEYNLWNELDIKGYGINVEVIGSFPGLVEDWIKNGERERAKEVLEELEKTCANFVDRISSIDCSKYDTRFPLDVLGSLHTRVIDAVTKIPQMTKNALEGRCDFRDVIRFAEDERKHLMALGRMIANHSGYAEYRALTSEDKRK